jgi:DNA-binding IclR family transcriptional regulator
MTEKVEKPRVPTLLKMGRLLNVFTLAKPVWRLHDLAIEMGWDDATAHRFLKALVEIRMLDEDENGAYRIGLRPLELAAISLQTEPRRQDLLRRMEEITEESGLTTQIGVLEGNSIVIAASRESHGALRAAALLGQRLPIHATAAGKALLTEFTDREIAEILPEKLERFTATTVTTREGLIREIEEVREGGLARVDSELSEGLFALAIPIPPRYFGSSPSALTCAGMSRSFVPEQWEIAEAALREQTDRFAQWRRQHCGTSGLVATSTRGFSQAAAPGVPLASTPERVAR